ncbi:hypothetical protein STIAU_2216 [Stigmatella aurantiaca DW4/3-1]|uniref:Uncharacterized protein n=1 Tax=Stigmatella aurantiaca (strain DW4/3-1) TaxID=378806 RepID=Q08TY3_STIAD|nr:hypothetical protein STIAU_2216 [Stigmatella aurantiaca DW4/3-1]
MQRGRVLLPVHLPTPGLHRIPQLVHIEGIGAEGEHPHLGRPQHPQTGDGVDARDEGVGRGQDAPRVLQVALLAQGLHHRPGRGDGPPGPRPRHGGGGVQPPRPPAIGEELMPPQGPVAVQHHRGPLGRIAILVEVRGQRGDPRDLEVERGNVPAELPCERQEEPPQTRIHMAQQPPGLGQRGQLGDGVQDTLGVRGGTAHDERRARGDEALHLPHIHPEIRPQGRVLDVHIEVMRRLLEGGVDRQGDDHLRTADALLLAGPLPGGLHRHHDALGAPRGHRARHVLIAVKQLRGHGNHVGLHAAQGRKGQGRQPILGDELAIGFLEQRRVLVIHVINEAEGTALLPARVFRAQGPQLREHFLFRALVLWQRLRRHPGLPHTFSTAPSTSHVRMERAERSASSRVEHHRGRALPCPWRIASHHEHQRLAPGIPGAPQEGPSKATQRRREAALPHGPGAIRPRADRCPRHDPSAR